jgi:prevent-host-death family protein
MTASTFSSRDFKRDVTAALRAAADGPVFITDRGLPAFALLKIEDCYRLAGDTSRSLLDAMDNVPGGDFDFEPPRLQGKPTPANLA